MYKTIKIILSVILVFSCLTANLTSFASVAYPSVSGISAKAYLVMDADTKTVLYASNQDEKLAMASTTKIMTTLIALEQENRDDYFVVDSEAIKTEGTSMGLQEGDKVSLNALCYGMILPSGNDAANATAVRIGSSFEGFAKIMNAKAKTLGMNSTNFTNPSGLPDDNHYSTAYDMALLGSEALLNEEFVKISSTKKTQVEFGNPINSIWLSNHNKMLTYYDGCVGLKTGFTDEAGRCLVTGVSRDGINLVCVTLNDPNDWLDHTNLLDMAYANIYKGKETFLDKLTEILTPQTTQSIDTIDVVGGSVDSVTVSEKPVSFTTLAPYLQGDFAQKLDIEVLLDPFYYAPLEKGEEVGKVIVSIGGVPICENPIVVDEAVDLPNGKQKPDTTKTTDEEENSIGNIIKWIIKKFT